VTAKHSKHNVASRAQCTKLYGCADDEEQPCANVAVDSDEDEDEDEEDE